MPKNQSSDRSPASLVAITYAAKAVGDRDLEWAAKQELLERFGIKLTFSTKPRPSRKQPPLAAVEKRGAVATA